MTFLHILHKISLRKPHCNWLKNGFLTRRWYWATQTNIQLDINDSTGIATLQLNKKPVNSLGLEMLTELNISLEKLENEKCRGVIITSALPGIFSAGIELMEMYQPDPDRLGQCWRELQDFWIKFYASKMVTIAAVNGHSIGAGCLLSLSADYRVMTEGRYTIGLIETAVGIIPHFWFQESMERVVGSREMERALQLGHLYSSTEALKVGLVDQVVPADQILSTANEHMTQWLKIPDFARQLTKQEIRKAPVSRLIMRRQGDIDNFVKLTMEPSFQKSLDLYLKTMKTSSDKA